MRTEAEVKAFDARWAAFPFQHPTAFWIRATEQEMVCTRCGKTLLAGRDYSLGEDPAPLASAWCEAHLKCSASVLPSKRPTDPLLALVAA